MVLDGGTLSIAQVNAVARRSSPARVEVSEQAVEKAGRSREALERLESAGEPIYGVTTGFGALRSEVIPPEDRLTLQENLIRSHAVGVGEPLDTACTRATMLVLAASLLRGHSGVGAGAAQLLCEFLNSGITPEIPSRGSLGASGDLAPLAHLALALIGEAPGLNVEEPLRLQSKLGLSLINGTHVHTGIAALLVEEAETLSKSSDIACAMNIEAMLCSAKPYRADVHALRPHPHQALSAGNIARLIAGSRLIRSHANCGEVQDAYSIRCAPQVHGACRQAVGHLGQVVEVELCSVTDNPLVMGEEVVSAGHFHGEPVGLALDYFKIGIAELAAISERRCERALNADSNRGLPPFLSSMPDLNCGLMVCQYTAAALVSEGKVLSHPSCVDSITTGANQEDHVSMAMNAALHAQQMVRNTRQVIAIELVVAAQALDCRREIQTEKPGAGVMAAWEAVRNQIPRLDEDRSLSGEVMNLNIERIIEAVESSLGALD